MRERARGSAHMLHTREKQTRRFAALSEHQHASTRLGMQCMNALMLCVWPDHACLSLGQEACSAHKGCMLRTPGSPWSSRRRPCTLVERLAAVGVVAQPDRQGQLGKADGRRVGLVGWWAGLWHWSSRFHRKTNLILGVFLIRPVPQSRAASRKGDIRES